MAVLLQLPLSLLRTAQNHPMLVELKNGETYNGHLVSCDSWMNIHLRDAICTSRVYKLVLQVQNKLSHCCLIDNQLFYYSVAGKVNSVV
jgi:small nuclear ribonucleoprotein (snRNP)-like protein